MSRALKRGLLTGVLVLSAAIARATPEEATWRRQTLLGQSAEHFFRYVAARLDPGFYYNYSVTFRLEKVRKSDLRIVESFRLRDVSYSRHPDSLRWSEESGPVSRLDLPSYLAANQVEFAFPNDLIHFRTFAIDSGGVWQVFEDGRIQLATRRELEQQIPMLGESPRVVGIEETRGATGEDFYLRIESGQYGVDWSEDLLIVRGARLH